MNKEAIARTKTRCKKVPREIYAVFGYMAAMAIASIVALFVTGVWWWLS